MIKLIETINNIVKLVSSLATLAVLGGIVYCGLCAYRWTSDTLSKPIQLPTVKLPDVTMPKIKVEAPEINLKAPTIDMSGLFGGKKEPEKDPMQMFEEFAKSQPEPSQDTLNMIAAVYFPCSHRVRCADLATHKFQLRQELFCKCNHSPPCIDSVSFELGHRDEMYANCRHEPKCDRPLTHFLRSDREAGL